MTQQIGRNEAAEGLIAARKLIAKQKNWVQNRAVLRRYFGPFYLGAARCSWGALDRACDDLGISTRPALVAFKDAIGTNIIDYNDAPGRTHAEVLAAFDRAISLAEKEARP